MAVGLRKREEVGVEKKAENRKKSVSKNKLPLATKLLIVFLVLIVSYSYGRGFMKLNSLNKELQALENELMELRIRNSQLLEDLEYISSEEAIEKIAREKLGLVKPNEIIVRQIEERD